MSPLSDDIFGPGHLTCSPIPKDGDVGLWSNASNPCEKLLLSIPLSFLPEEVTFGVTAQT